VPEGELRARLSGVLELPAALPIARVSLRRRRLRVVDGTDKTVARLVIDAPAVRVDGRGPERLATTADGGGVRGYDKPARRVRREVERDIRRPSRRRRSTSCYTSSARVRALRA
jgi:hypothetical protein